jgi:hypothetical protein
MQSSDDYKKNKLYDQLLKSIDETFLKKSSIPEKDRICFALNLSKETAQKQLEEHKARCREKYGTDEGVIFWNINYFPGDSK